MYKSENLFHVACNWNSLSFQTIRLSYSIKPVEETAITRGAKLGPISNSTIKLIMRKLFRPRFKTNSRLVFSSSLRQPTKLLTVPMQGRASS